MKKTIYIIMIILLISIVKATTDVEIAIESEQEIDSTIVQIGEEDINTDLYCVAGNDCNFNIDGGDLNVPEGVNVNQHNEYNSYGGGGMSFTWFVRYIESNFYKYAIGKQVSENVNRIIDSFANVFVTREEFVPSQVNIDYLANEVDKIKAEKYAIKQYFNITLNEEYVKIVAGAYKSQRIEQPVQLDNGYLCNYVLYGMDCIKVW